MKLLTCSAKNFGSYEQLFFDFQDQGLTLIHGPTGSGKSTIEDLAAWTLFGVTAKDGNADEVRSWAVEEPTQAVLSLMARDSAIILVDRTRGTSKQNDLWWSENGEIKRGKDVNETQKLLEQRLGVTADLYLTGAYFHEFSRSGTFFLAKASDRRKVFEQIANLQFPTALAVKISENAKLVRVKIEATATRAARWSERESSLIASVDQLTVKSERWDKDHIAALESLRDKANKFSSQLSADAQIAEDSRYKFELDRLKRAATLATTLGELEVVQLQYDALEAEAGHIPLETRCPTCDAPSESAQLSILRQRMSELKDRLSGYRFLKKDLETVMNQANPYKAPTTVSPYPDLIAQAESRVNPHRDGIMDATAQAEIAHNERLLADHELEIATKRSSSLSQLQDLVAELRGELVRKTVSEIETDTNRMLETYFEGALRIQFTIEGADSIDVRIAKDGYQCVYRQLSKGQRGMLRLCFVVAVMKAAANNAGVHFDTLFMDEALDGLDGDLKVKAFSLLEELSKDHGSVFVIDHDEGFKTLFSNRYAVSMNNDRSEIDHEQ